MLQTFEIENVKCSGCAHTLKSKLKDEFGAVEVNLDIFPRQITLDIDESRVPMLGEALKKIGYPMSSDELGIIDGITTKAKSFVSCAIGKIEQK